MAGLAVAKRVGTIPGIVLCALAAGVKSPAALGVLFLGWVWAGPGANVGRRIAQTALAGIMALATMEVVALISGTGWGWIRTTSAADASFTGVTPVNVVARFASIVTHVFQMPLTLLDVRPVFIILGLATAVYVGWRQLLRAPEDGVVKTLGITLLVLALLGPIVWSWYVTWGIVVLAACARGRMTTMLIVVSTFWAFAGLASVHNIFERMLHTFAVTDLFLVALLAAIVLVPLGQFAAPRIRRETMPTLPPGEPILARAT
jgi:alpha-1,6-mannosyltransferase